eukprot:TRINITY_DN10970_c0_g1_i2.p4 TRINITY_DN10970_c0_g1~~TRINITY_DN10970_c0_g1_i2.p4  ORF type:complete len:142 (-),score=3.53 TRINITY_DN10970_c0_g1_i2:550-975(-)
MTSTNQFNCINVKRQFQRKSWFAVGNSCIKKFSCVQKGGVKASNGVRQRFYNKCAPFFVSILANTPVHVSLASVLTEVEPANALSLPTWIIHVSSVAECGWLLCKAPQLLLEIQPAALRRTEYTRDLNSSPNDLHRSLICE